MWAGVIHFAIVREAPVRFGSVTVWRWNGSRFRFSVPAVPLQKGFFFQYSLTEKDGSGFGSWKTVPAVPVPLSVSGKTVPTVPVSGSGSVPEPSCIATLVAHRGPTALTLPRHHSQPRQTCCLRLMGDC